MICIVVLFLSWNKYPVKASSGKTIINTFSLLCFEFIVQDLTGRLSSGPILDRPFTGFCVKPRFSCRLFQTHVIQCSYFSRSYNHPTNKKHDDPSTWKSPKKVLPVISEITFRGLHDPRPVKPDMDDQQYQQKKRQIQVDVSPLVAVQPEEVFIAWISFPFRNYKAQ